MASDASWGGGAAVADRGCRESRRRRLRRSRGRVRVQPDRQHPASRDQHRGGRASDSVPGTISLTAFVLRRRSGGTAAPTGSTGARWPTRTATAIAVEVVAIAASAALWLAGASNAVVVGPIAAAMGVQTTLAGRVALEHLTSGFLTGTLSSAAMRSPLGDRSNPWWWYALAPLLVLIVAAGAVSMVAVESVSWALGIAAVLALAAWMVSWSATDAGRRSART